MAVDIGLGLRLEVNHLLMNRLFGGRQHLYELADAALELVYLALAAGALVHQVDAQARVEERQLPQAAGQGIEAEIDIGEDLRVRLEANARARLIGLADGGETLFGHAA